MTWSLILDTAQNFERPGKRKAQLLTQSLILNFISFVCVLVNVCVYTHNLFHKFKLMCHYLTQKHNTGNNTGQFTDEYY